MRAKTCVWLEIVESEKSEMKKEMEEIGKEQNAKYKKLSALSENFVRYEFEIYQDDPLYERLVEMATEGLEKIVKEEDLKSHVWLTPGFPEYTEEELTLAVGYQAGFMWEFDSADCEDDFLKWCDGCHEYTEQIGDYILKKSAKLKKWNESQKNCTFAVTGSDDLFVTIPMYEYLLENGISCKNFRPIYFGKRKKDLAGYQIVPENQLPLGSLKERALGERCPECGRYGMDLFEMGFYTHNIYLDWDRIDKWEDINEAGTGKVLQCAQPIFSLRMYDVIKKANPKIWMQPVFPFSMKNRLER